MTEPEPAAPTPGPTSGELPMTISRQHLRVLALGASLPFAFFGYNALPVSAATPTCAGQAATMVVTAGSAHSVRGTDHRDVIVIRDAGHVVRAHGGNDLVCGSGGHDTVFGGHGRDRILGFAGRDNLVGGDDDEQGDDGDDVLAGNSGDDDLVGGSGDDELEGDQGDDDCDEGGVTTAAQQQCDDQDDDDQGENDDSVDSGDGSDD